MGDRAHTLRLASWHPCTLRQLHGYLCSVRVACNVLLCSWQHPLRVGQALPATIHTFRPWTTFLPLGLVLGIAMMKEAVEDYKRYRQDVEVNNRGVEVGEAPATAAAGNPCNRRSEAVQLQASA